MKPLLFFTLLLLLFCPAKVRAESENGIRQKQPGGEIVVLFTRESDPDDYSITLLTPDGKRLLNKPVGPSVSPIIWNKAGTVGAFSAGSSFLMDCYIIFLQAPDYKLVKLQGPEHGWDNCHSTPVRWSKDILQLNIDGPHAGKSEGYHFSGRMKFSVKSAAEAPRVIEEKVDVDNDSGE